MQGIFSKVDTSHKVMSENLQVLKTLATVAVTLHVFVFVYVHFRCFANNLKRTCFANNLKRTSKMLTLPPPWKNLCGRPWPVDPFHLSSSLDQTSSYATDPPLMQTCFTPSFSSIFVLCYKLMHVKFNPFYHFAFPIHIKRFQFSIHS